MCVKGEDLTFTAEAGQAYLVCGDSRGYLEPRIYLWIEEERTGRVIAGGKP